MNPRDGAIRLVQLINNSDVAKELELRSEVIKCDISFGWIAKHIERSLGYPKSFAVEAVEGADAVAVLLANEHVTYEVRRLFSLEAGTDPAAAMRRLQRAAAQAPQTTRTINKSADALMQEISARNPGSSALDFSGQSQHQAPPPGSLGLTASTPSAPPPGTTVVGSASGLIHPPPPRQEVPEVVGPAPAATTAPPENGHTKPPPVRNARGHFVNKESLKEALDAGDLDAVRALLG